MTESSELGEERAALSLTSTADVQARLADLVVAQGIATRERIEELQHRSKWLDEPLDRILVRESVLPEDAALALVSQVTGIPQVPLSRVGIEDEAVKLVPPRIVAHYRIMPVRVYGGTITVATDRLGELGREDQLRLVLGCTVRWVLCKTHEISECIKHYYGVGLRAFVGLAAAEEKARAGGRLQVSVDGSDISAFVNEIVRDGVVSGATDIHFEPYENKMRLRYRIDGVLTPIPLPQGAEKHQKAIVSSIKVMAQLNIAEKRIPQDGRFGFKVDERELDVRVSVLPSQHGEAVNLRILNRREIFLKMEQLGLRDFQLTALEELVALPYGIILFVGATGSGKTTSLYASVSKINNEDLKIITIEDPVEYQVDGINQMQIHPEVDFTFATGLRSILRHDPDVVLIGEIRDSETARIATSAALTGHLVFSTLHTNDSASAIPRLIDMGIEPYLVASSVQGIIAQQLLRRVCNSCKVELQVEPKVLEEIREVWPDTPAHPRFYQGRGCPDCRFTGFSGRRGLYEVIVMDDNLRALTVERASSATIMQRAMSDGLVTLRQSGWLCALEGTTTIDEVLRVTPRVGGKKRHGGKA